MVLLAIANPVLGQTPAKPTAQAPTAGGGAKKPGVPQVAPAPAAPQSKHFPILLVASGVEPQWSVRIGMKGAERLERAGYPPITLEPGEISADDSGTAWTYRAKDAGTGGDVTVRLSRETCTEGSAQTKYSFRAVVTHAQIGILNGCAKIAAEEFPEFKQKNLDDEDPEKKKVLPPPITGFKAPAAMAFIDAAGKLVLVRSGVTKIVAPAGNQLSLSHDGKRLLFTHDEQGKDRTIMMYDAVSGKITELMRGLVQQAFWSPDDSRIAFMRSSGPDWTVWTMPAGSPEKALQLSTGSVWALHGWLDAHTMLASDVMIIYFLRTESPPTSTAIREVYGDGYEVMSSDTIRANPVNADLLMVTAYVSHPKAGMPTDAKHMLSPSTNPDLQDSCEWCPNSSLHTHPHTPRELPLRSADSRFARNKVSCRQTPASCAHQAIHAAPKHSRYSTAKLFLATQPAWSTPSSPVRWIS